MKFYRRCPELKLLLVLLLTSNSLPAQKDNGRVFLFSYFKNNGEDGLHLASSRDGFQWQALFADTAILHPAIGNERLMRDPCIIKGPDRLFHMVWTLSWADRAIGYASSKDLIHWSPQQLIPVMADEPAARNCWAPEIIYDPTEKQYMIYWATTIPGRFPLTDSSSEDRYNHRIYFTTTKDCKTFSKARVLYDQGFNAIDATIQMAGGKYIMFLKDETLRPTPQKNIRIAVSNHLTGGYGKPSPRITGEYWAEGPTVTRIGNKWIVYFDKYALGKYGAVLSSDLVHWEEVSDRVHLPTGIRHGTIFQVTTAEFKRLQSRE